MLRRLLATIALIVCTPIGSAAADSGPIATVALEIRGTAEPALRSQLQRSIAKGFKQAGVRSVSNDEVIKAIGKRNELVGCTSSSCLERIGTLVKAHRFLRVRVEADGAAYKVALELLDARGQTKHRLEKSCAVCTLTEVNEIVHKRAYELVTTSPAKPVAVEIVSRPEGAKLSIGDRHVGQAPFQGKLAPGKHTIKALLGGHTEVEKTIEVKGAGSAPERFVIVLTPIAAVQTPKKKSPPSTRFRILKWGAAGGAVVSLVAGAVLISMHNDPTCTLTGSQEQCERLKNTLPGGLLALAGGIGLGATSVWMFKSDSKERRKRRAVLIPKRGGAVGALMWSW